MANSLGNRLARIDVLIGGADQAQKQVDKMRDEWKKLRKEVENAQEQMNATTNTTLYDDNKKIYNEKVKQLERLTKLIRENQRNVNTVNKYLNDISGQTLRNLGEARKGLNQMLLGINPKNAETLQTVRDYIKQIADEIQRRKGNLLEFSDIIGDIGNVSDKSLGMAKERLQDLVKSTQLNTQEIQKYREQLAQVEAEETRRVSQRAQSTLGKVQTGTFDGTIGQAKEAIKLLEQYKQQLKTSDTQGIKEVEEAINALNEKVKQTSSQYASLEEALKQASKVGQGTFGGTNEDLEKLKKTLEEYKKQLKVSDTEGLKKVNDALRKVEKQQKEAVISAKDLKEVLLDLKTSSLEDLQRAAARLQAELSQAKRDSREYVETSMDLRRVNEQINEVKRSWQEHDNQIAATIKRLTSYVLVYAGFNEVVGRIKQVYQANLQLSDSLADIQKTTGLSTESVSELSREIDAIDTRTAQQELHDLAYEAGKLGISAKEDVLGFVKAGNQLLVALGEDLGGAEAVRQLMKVNAILGETQKLGVEKALLATGSAINEISQTSRASAGPIVDIVTRIGAIGEAAGLSMSNLIALGGTVDALGQNAEMSGTALNTFISTLTSNTTEVAQAVGLSDDYLKSLINQGKTMEAIIAVFEKMNAMGGLDVLAPIMKGLGSDGERIKQVLVTLSSSVDELKAQVFTSSQAFKEATSVTDEYNIKNENAMAIMKRMGNAIQESFINSGFVQWLTDVLRYIASIPNRFERGEKFIRFMAVTLQVLVGVMIATSSAVQKASANILLFSNMVKAGTASINIFKTAWQALTFAMTKNPLGWVVLAITAITSAITAFKESVNEAAKAQAEFESTIEKERLELNNLRYAIKNANDETGERAYLIKQLNDKYGAYIGFLVTEYNYEQKKEYIYKLINSRLREMLALKMRDKMMENIADKYTDQIQELQSKIIASLNEMQNVGETNAGDAMARIMDGMNKVVEEGGNLYDALDGFMKKYDKNIKQLPFSSDALKLMNILKKIREEAGQTELYLESASRSAEKQADALMRTDLQKSNKGILSTSNLQELNTYLQQATTYVQRLRDDVDELNAKREKGEKLTKAETADLENKKKQLDIYQNNIEQVEKRIKAIGMESVWGQGVSLETAGVDKLVATYKKLEAMMKSINEDKDYADTFAARGFKSAKEEYEALKKMEEDVAKVLAEKWGRDTSGNWLKVRKSGTRGEQKEMNDEMTAALSALETYFVSREALIKERRASEEITEQEMNRQLEGNEFAHLTARIKLRRMFLGDMKALSKEELETYGLEGKDLEKLSNYLLDKGQAMRDGIRLKLAEDELKMREDLLKHQAAIRKILLDNDYTGQVDKEFMSAIDKLELLFGKQEEMTEEAGERRMKILRSMASEAYLIDVTEFQKRIDAQSEFSEWRKDKTTEDYQALLYMLQKYNDDYEAAENRAIERRKKIAEKKWEKSGQKEDWQTKTDKSQANVDLMQSASSIGLASDSMVEDAKLEYYKLRIEASKAYLMQMEQEMQMEVDKAYQEKLLADEIYNITKGTDYEDEDARLKALEATATYEAAKRAQMQMTLDARQQLNEAMIDLDKQEMEIQERKLETLKGYTDAIVEFSGQMGEAAFGEVEDRKEAAKQLVQTTMRLTKDLIMQKVQELITKKALKQQEVAIEQTGNQSITKSAGSTIIAGLTASEKGMGGKISGAIAGGSAKIIEQLGWWGIPLIAVITAALNGLMGLAMGAFSKSKAEVAAATGASTSQKGRVAAGMLTYKNGDYPVLANDGKIYNASYQKELKTGVYGGGAHFGIFSEKKPEMIVDGDTTQKLILNYPHIYESILTIARHGQLKRAAMPAFAGGSYPSIPAQVQQPSVAAADAGMSNAQMAQTLADVASAVAALTDRLNKPISATMDPYEANKTLRKTNTFMEKKGLINKTTKQ